MPFSVKFTAGARTDLRSIHAYISKNDSPEKAQYVAQEIVQAALTLREFPERGSHPPELLRFGKRTYRQILFKPYRIFYRIHTNTVYVALIADGRRDMQTLLASRLLKS